jgi:hypothetical protein
LKGGENMSDKELRRLSRMDLIEMLLEQSKHVAELEEKLKDAEEKLSSREILLDEAGNIAEAALRLNHIFEDAQAASEQYIQGLRDLYIRKNGLDPKLADDYDSSHSNTENISGTGDLNQEE